MWKLNKQTVLWLAIPRGACLVIHLMRLNVWLALSRPWLAFTLACDCTAEYVCVCVLHVCVYALRRHFVWSWQGAVRQCVLPACRQMTEPWCKTKIQQFREVASNSPQYTKLTECVLCTNILSDSDKIFEEFVSFTHQCHSRSVWLTFSVNVVAHFLFYFPTDL